jgi:hypothetical protein
MIFAVPKWGYYLFAMVCFVYLWINAITTVNSLRFENPKINFMWFVTFPMGSLVGLAYIVWTVVNFDVIYFS